MRFYFGGFKEEVGLGVVWLGGNWSWGGLGDGGWVDGVKGEIGGLGVGYKFKKNFERKRGFLGLGLE